MQSFSAAAIGTSGSRASRISAGTASSTFCAKLSLEHLGSRVESARSLFPAGWQQMAWQSGAVERLRGFPLPDVLLRVLML